MFNYRTHGKWILAGEHSILRGGTALVFPVKTRFLDFIFEKSDVELHLQMNIENQELINAFWKVFDKATQTLGLKRDQFKGRFNLSSNIPVGAGMGASATLCVSLSHFFFDQGFLKKEKLYEFAKNLENIFHGESSGVDVAIALHNQALEFTRPDQVKFFKPSWEPFIYLSYCGKKGITSECVARVQKLIKDDYQLGLKIDEQMQLAVEKVKVSLLEHDKKSLLIEGIELALDCFEKWDLISLELKTHMSDLKNKGAIAVKPTGSGDGGFVLSLWENNLTPEKLNLIKAY